MQSSSVLTVFRSAAACCEEATFDDLVAGGHVDIQAAGSGSLQVEEWRKHVESTGPYLPLNTA